MNTQEQEKRARRAKALREKAASTSFSAEAASLIAKAEELEKINADSGYRESVTRDFMTEYIKAASDEKIRQYQEYVRTHGERGPNCICGTVEQKFLGFECPEHPKKKRTPGCTCTGLSYGLDYCPVHGYKGDSENDPHKHSHIACILCGKKMTREEYRSHKCGNYERTNDRRKSTSHADCYAQGLHDNSKAGRAQCRRGRV